MANAVSKDRLRYSVSLVRQGKQQFYTLTMPSDVLARTCTVSTRDADPKKGFQRVLDTKRADEIAAYIDSGLGTIPNSIVLSAQASADAKIIGKGKTFEFNDTPGAFLILDGQHRVYGFSRAQTSLRVPVVVYNGLTRQQESRLFIDINTKQRPVPTQLLLDIKNLADIETSDETLLREVFDLFDSQRGSALQGLLSKHQSVSGKVNRVTFNAAVKPLAAQFSDREPSEIFRTLNNYLLAVASNLDGRLSAQILAKPVVFRAIMGLFPNVATRVKDRFDATYTADNFSEIVAPIFSHFPVNRFLKPGTSSVALRDYLDKRMREKTTF